VSSRVGVDDAAAWVYRGVWRAVTRWFRVPPQPPQLPIAPGEPSESFRPARGFLSYLRFQFWVYLVVVDLGIVVAWIAILVAAPVLALVFLPIALIVAVAPDVIAYVAIHLRYDTTWYVMSPRALRIRRGIWIITEVTITFENVQNVRVTQGPLQRFFGIANVEVQTAGGGGAGPEAHGSHGHSPLSFHRGLIEGVDNAHAIRELITSRLRESRTAGLGDDEVVAGAGSFSAAHLAVLGEIRDELRALAQG
jgi:membrane protein YdbS with pleckstrin-like domain